MRLLLILVMLAALVLAACGGGDDEEETSVPPTEDTTAQTQTDETETEEVEEVETEEPETEEVEEATEEPATEETEQTSDVVETAAASDFNTLIAAVEAAGLTDALSAEGPFTVFAPTDEAFQALLEAEGLTLEDLTADTEALSNILLYHVVEGAVTAEQVMGMDGETVTTLSGGELTISVDGETVMVNNATVIMADVQASNGIIHVIDSVLMPMAEEAEMTEEETTEMASTGDLITSVCLV
ncbi:MAG: hypothetical protein CUN56_11895, partial [Phototrophicales bacterium]